MDAANPKVDAYIDRNEQWAKELVLLRKIVTACPLEEDLKWGVPCYTYNGSNVVLLHVFKEYAGVLFPKGALLQDPENILLQQTENVQSARQARFTSVKEINAVKQALTACIYEAIEVEKAGLKVPKKKASDYAIADEFAALLKKKPAVKKAFEALTPGRQRAYLLFFAAAKQAKTRQARVDKYEKQILAGKGLDD